MRASPSRRSASVLFTIEAPSKEEARDVLDSAFEHGMTFAESTENLVALSKHMSHLAALGLRTELWDVAFIETRTRRVPDLARARLWSWLE
jgi:hypothetical protein